MTGIMGKIGDHAVFKEGDDGNDVAEVEDEGGMHTLSVGAFCKSTVGVAFT